MGRSHSPVNVCACADMAGNRCAGCQHVHSHRQSRQRARRAHRHATAHGSFQFRFANASGVLFRVLASTDMTLPLSNWSVLGYLAETTSGLYVFTDTQASIYPKRFYRATYP